MFMKPLSLCPAFSTAKLAVAVAAVALVGANAHAGIILSENFDGSTALPTGWSSTGNVEVRDDNDLTQSYALSGTNTLWIVETRNSNIVTAPTLDLTGATEATISFQWTTDAPRGSKFGRVPQVQYSSNGGVNWATIGTFTIPSSTTTIPAYTLFSDTITTGEVISGVTISFTSTSVFRIVGDNDGGGSGGAAIIDDFSIASDVPEPGSLALMGLGGLLMMRRRRD